VRECLFERECVRVCMRERECGREKVCVRGSVYV